MFKELVEITYKPSQNAALERSFMSFYKLNSHPKIRRKLIVDKDEYKRFIKSKTRVRTKFEINPSEIDLSFDSFRPDFEFLGTLTEFTIKNGDVFLLNEELDGPNGASKTIEVTQTIGNDVIVKNYKSYFDAEQYILEKFIESGDQFVNS